MSIIIGLIGPIAKLIDKAIPDPEPLYAFFGTGYLGYKAARALGKAKGVER